MPARWLQPLGFYQVFVWWQHKLSCSSLGRCKQPKRIYDGACIATKLL